MATNAPPDGLSPPDTAAAVLPTPIYKSEGFGAPAAPSELATWSQMAERAFAANTLRAWKADWAVFDAFCASRQLARLPAAALTVREFVFECLRNNKKPATVRRYVATIARAHRAASVADPTVSEAVKLALKEMGRTVPARQKQARGLVWEEIARFLEFVPRTLREHRDRALVAAAYDTMCRREELVSLRVEDLAYSDDGSATVLIRRSKTDTAGEGATAYLSPLTVKLLATWLTEAGLATGPMFVRRKGSDVFGEALTAQTVAAVFRKVGRWSGLPDEEWQKISGHSARVGAAQDLLALNIDLASVMQTGRWKDTRMPMRYGEKVLARRGGMARAAKEQGRA